MSTALPPKQPNVAAHVLCRFMALLSEEYDCSRWHIGLEYGLWSNMMRRGLGKGVGTDSVDMEALAWPAHEAGGWWYWDEEASAQFSDLASWQAEYDRARENARVLRT